MGSAFKHIGASLARAEVGVARAIGELIEFQHRSEPCRNLWANLGDEEISIVQDGGVDTEVRTREFRIPIQEHFEDNEDGQEPITPGDKIVMSQREYHVMVGGINKEGFDGIYVVRAVQRKRLSSGVRG